ncbi:uncharacterized protein STEHIDRAFT_138020 [Stereum hirsutum FP-91666 SS1]|uniref:uncharacterized protein n=1 Tax=Stereum hirsutum (strain FP-91666) TaxID=721885 RepID=UPI000440B45F|nr:uncharacterized protein STEHIDRAFT_138020 [Stereum hirsutum FP-91666 SS1]EIM88839.1 hypothetical protein STEHIDRAFT_138020 [Stereum hirsutum FP-91666 SS1]
MAAANHVFKFSREAYAVIVDRIPPGVGRREIVDLFSTLVGDIRKVEDRNQGHSMEITFHTHDAARKALCMTGYTISGVPLSVTAVAPPKMARGPHNGNRVADARRNLYVLGLPFDLSKNEFAELFSRYGTVSHCVILATVDNASRRRGFIVMSTNAEARAAMDGLSRTEIKGSVIDVSWAVVQRSQGFLDGGDRALPTRDAPAEDIPRPKEPLADLTHPTMSSIVVSNLPTVLFSQPSDIEPLLMPFGDVKKIERLPSVAGSASAYSGLFSIMVTYASPESAREARDTLHGQVYGNQALFVEISGGPGGQVDRLSDVHRSTAPPGLQQNQQKWSSNPTKSPSAFNPRASPFAFDYNSFASHNSAPPTCTIASPRLDYFESFVSNNNFSNSNNGHINYSENSLPPSLSYAKPHAPSTMSTGLAIPSETYQPQPQPLSTVSNVDWSLSSNTSRAPFLNPSQSASQYPLRSTSAASWWSASGTDSGSAMRRLDAREHGENRLIQSGQAIHRTFLA